MSLNKTKINALQLQKMVEFVENNPKVQCSRSDTSLTSKTKQDLWHGLTAILNSIGGCKKTTDKWRKTWSDMKTAVKVKSAKIKAAQYRAGPLSSALILSPIEERIAALIHIGDSVMNGSVEEKQESSLYQQNTNVGPVIIEVSSAATSTFPALSIVPTPKVKVQEILTDRLFEKCNAVPKNNNSSHSSANMNPAHDSAIVNASIESPNINTTHENADDLFGRFISEQFKTMAEGYAKEMCRIEVMQLVLKYKFSCGIQPTE